MNTVVTINLDFRPNMHYFFLDAPPNKWRIALVCSSVYNLFIVYSTVNTICVLTDFIKASV